jgi:hypothetical protein
MRALASIGALLGAILAAWAIWLLVTPDYDGGRRPVGAMVVGPAALLIVGSLLILRRLRSRP